MKMIAGLVPTVLLALALIGVHGPAFAQDFPLCSEAMVGDLCIPDNPIPPPSCFDFSGQDVNPNLSVGQSCTGPGDICFVDEVVRQVSVAAHRLLQGPGARVTSA